MYMAGIYKLPQRDEQNTQSFEYTPTNSGNLSMYFVFGAVQMCQLVILKVILNKIQSLCCDTCPWNVPSLAENAFVGKAVPRPTRAA